MWFRLMADASGADFFGCSLWHVPAAHVLRYQICRKVALRLIREASHVE